MSSETEEKPYRLPYKTYQQQRKEAWEAIEKHRESLETAPEDKHNEAVKHFDTYASDLHSPQLIREVLIERDRVKEEAVKNNQVVDWESEYRGIADRVRERAGLPTASEVERYEVIADMKRSRGK